MTTRLASYICGGEFFSSSGFSSLWAGVHPHFSSSPLFSFFGDCLSILPCYCIFPQDLATSRTRGNPLAFPPLPSYIWRVGSSWPSLILVGLFLSEPFGTRSEPDPPLRSFDLVLSPSLSVESRSPSLHLLLLPPLFCLSLLQNCSSPFERFPLFLIWEVVGEIPLPPSSPMPFYSPHLSCGSAAGQKQTIHASDVTRGHLENFFPPLLHPPVFF